jgi:hypothetical protein
MAKQPQEVPDPAWKADRLREEYIYYGFQYYLAARFATAGWAHPVAANLFHHAIEMLLKGGLCPHTTEAERKKMGHRLPRIWDAFRTCYHPSKKLSHFDELIKNLHKYEDIRYPEKIALQGINSSFQFGNAPPKTKVTRNPPIYHLSVGEVDALVKAICSAISINPKFFTTRFQPPGSTYLRYENVEDL